MIKLPNVALVAIDNVCHDLTRKAIERCLRHVEPAEVLIFSDRDIGVSGARTLPIGDVRSNRDAERVMYEGVAPHLNHDFALYMQWDGWIVRPDMWTDEFLSYDWIGAPWSWHKDGLDVGNGGFSLRSKKLLDVLYENREGRFAFNMDDHEDQQICRIHRRALEAEFGLRWAPFDLARRFSVEHGNWDAFGFHGMWNMARFQPEHELVESIRGLRSYNFFRPDMGMLHSACVERGYFMATQALRLAAEGSH